MPKYKAFTKEEELDLIRRWQENKDNDAGEKLIKGFERLILKSANYFAARNRHVSRDDLISEGQIGFLRAVDGFDSELGYRLATYAAPAIRNDMKLFALKQRSIAKAATSGSVRSVFENISRAENKISQRHPDASPLEFKLLVAKDLGVTLEELETAKARNSVSASLNVQVNMHDGNKSAERIDLLEEHEGDNTTEQVIEADELSTLQDAFTTAVGNLKSRGKLNDRDLDIFTRRKFGDETLEDLGKEFKVSRERIRQIEVAAFTKIQKECRVVAPHLFEADNFDM